MADLSLDLCGVKLKNPIIAASGTFGFGREYDELYDIGQLGGISVKGLSLLPRTGNPPSRIAETPSGMLNSVGLQNPGVESFIENDLPWLLTKNVAVIANITGTSVEQYVQMAERLAGTGVHLLEMNISCPNVHEGGVAFGVKPESVYAITKAVKAAAKQPLIVKLTPNVSDITENALAAEEAGANAISMINTLTGIAVDTNKRKMVLANNTGGLSGPAVRPVALRMVWQSAKKVHIPIIGMGGIETGEDAAAFMLCGAKAVMVGTANFTDPFACPRIIRELDAYCDRQNVRSAQELVGTLVANRKAVSKEDLEKERLILLSGSDKTERLAAWTIEGVAKPVYAYVNSQESVETLVAAGYGMSMAVKSACRPHPNLAYVPMKEPHMERICLLWNKNQPTQAWIERFTSFLMMESSEM